MRVRWLHKLSVKLILVISGILLTNLALYTFFTTSRLESELTQVYSQNAYYLSDVIKKSTRYSMLLNRSEDVRHIINTIGTGKDVIRIRIYSNTGNIIFSTDSTETSRSAGNNAEGCNICHTKSQALTNVQMQNRIRFYTDPDGTKSIELINSINNEKDCYNSGCHAQQADQDILGVLDVVISIDPLEKIIKSNKRNIMYSSIAVTVIVSVFCVFFISVMVNRPIMKINKGIREIGKGRLDYKIPIDSNDELGHMAYRFNEMSAKLDTAYKEIKDWSETLNVKVTEKTDELKKIHNHVIQIEKLASLGKLSATVAHELNNPLEGILTYSKLISKQLQKLQKDNEYEKVLGYLTMISDESSRCGKIVKDLLIFSHRDEEMFTREDAHGIIRKSLSLIRHYLQLHTIEAEENYAAPHSVIICNPQNIQQALLALFMNAIEAMNYNGKLIVETASDDKDIIIRIKDTGPGIQPKDLPYIYDPFYTTKTEGKGTGLGLAVVYGILNHHKGSVEVENTSPEGTVFRITLPLPEKPDC